MENEINPYISLLNSLEETEIVNAIKEIEKKTSGEIRVHISNKKNITHTLEYAKNIFNDAKLYETEQRNAVLIFISTQEKTFTIIGDKGIDKVVKQQFWEEIKDNAIEKFKNKFFLEGILYSVQAVGDKLIEYFPWEENDKNELPDEIFYS